MNRQVLIHAGWFVVALLGATGAYFAGNRDSAPRQVVAESQSATVGHTTDPSVDFAAGEAGDIVQAALVPAVDGTNKPVYFLATTSICDPKGKLDINPCQSPKKPDPIPYNPNPPKDPEPPIKKPACWGCRVKDSKGHDAWGICCDRKF